MAQTLIYGIIVYAMMGFEWTASKFLWYIFFNYFTFLYYTFYGMMTMAISPNQHVAAIMSTSFYAIWNLFSGFIIPLSVSYTTFTSFINSCMIIVYKLTLKIDNNDREYQYGGNGTIGFVLLHGPYMDCWPLNTETTWTNLRMVKGLKNL